MDVWLSSTCSKDRGLFSGGGLHRRAAGLTGLLLLAFGNACGGNVGEDPVTTNDESAVEVTLPVQPLALGALSLELTYTGSQRGAALASLWPLTNAAGDACPLSCVRQTSPCASECDARVIRDDEAPGWPGATTLTFDRLEPATYWLYAYVMVGEEHREGPRRGDPVSQRAPLSVRVAPGLTARASLTLDASWVGASAPDPSECARPSESWPSVPPLELDGPSPTPHEPPRACPRAGAR